MSMSDRMAVMRDGRIVESGAPEALYDRPRTAFVADFLGDANVLSAAVRARRNGHVTVVAGGGRFEAAVDDDQSVADGATVMIRPEALRLGGETLTGTVRSVEYKGAFEEYTVDLDAGETVRVRSGTGDRVAVDDTVGLAVAEAAVVDGAAGPAPGTGRGR